MGVMPKKKTLTVQRVLALVIAYITLCVGGGVVTSIFFMPAVFAANNAAKAVIPSLAVEGIDFDVTSLPQRSTMYFNDGKTAFAEFYTQNREVVPLKKISKAMQQAVVAREDSSTSRTCCPPKPVKTTIRSPNTMRRKTPWHASCARC